MQEDYELAVDEGFTSLLDAAARWLCKSTDLTGFCDWIAEAGPMLAPLMAAQVAPGAGTPQDFFRSLGLNLYYATPLPERNFKPQPMPKPGRNDPCFCGSGRKYKQCCIGLETDLSDLREGMTHNMLRFVLDNLPIKSFSALPASQVDIDGIQATALQWRDEGELKRAISLLEAWFKPDVKLKEKHSDLFHLLMDLYLEGGNTVKHKKLLARMFASDNKMLRSDAYQRQAAILTDKGEYRPAWESFREAQRLEPNSPSLAVLEITMHTATGATELAKERARFWLAYFRRAGGVPEELMDKFEAFAQDPMTAMAQTLMSSHQNADVQALCEQLQGAPAVAAHYRLQCHDAEAALQRDKTMDQLEQQWQDKFQSLKPSLTYTQHDNPDVWLDAHKWLPLLVRKPQLWNSFEVLDDLIMAVNALNILSLVPVLLEPLLDRAVALLEKNLVGFEGELPWGFLENRPALRTLAHKVFYLQKYSEPGFLPLAERLIQLNPNDNHGVREILSSAYIAQGELEKAIVLETRYPDDMMCTLKINKVLALYLSNQAGEALSLLTGMVKRYGEVIRMLLADNPREPKFAGPGIGIGSKEEAWLYRESNLPLWQQQGALEWLRQAWKSLKHK